MNIYSYPSQKASRRIEEILGRRQHVQNDQMEAVSDILNDVRKNGDQAVISCSRRFDSKKMSVDLLRVTKDEFEKAETSVDASMKRALKKSADHIKQFHKRQIEHSWFTADRPGTFLGQMVRPVETAGLYVPGGKGGDTPLVSSALMTGIPAKIAGVRRVIMCTPPRPDGSVNPCLLSAAKIVGVDAVYKAGSAWAVGAMAYGTETIPKCDVIAGPGNRYVALAKKLVSGAVGIDMVAGPSEILIIADDSANPAFVAADLLSQAEHDAQASSVLVTCDDALAEAVNREVSVQLATLPRKEIAAASIEQYGAILRVADIAAAIDLSNRFAPEHLELQVREPMDVIGEIRNAGAVFLGEYTPEPVGDYMAGPNHVLPTAGCARFSSALSVSHFTKKTSIVRYDREAFHRDARDIIRLAETEGLDAHARAIRMRMPK